MAQNKKPKNYYKAKSRPILSLLIGLGLLSVILLVTMMSASKDTVYRGNTDTAASQGNAQITPAGEASQEETLAIVKSIDPANRTIMLYAIDKKELLELNYTGGTNITDKYGTIISMSQIEIGSMVDATYQEDKKKLTDMNISTKAWEYVGVSNLSIDLTADIMKITSTKYKYEEDILILDEGRFIPVTELKEQDELTIRGFEETIWSITVTRGHGTVVLEDYENFLGSTITIGYEAMQQITENMEITVREGKFNLTVERADYSATKNITVYRNKTTYVSLSDLGPVATQQSKVTFEITPLGADLYIDGELTTYADPIELKYGEHRIEVSLGGYTTYEGILTVDSAGKTIKIDLPEAASEQETKITETQADTSDTTAGDTTTGDTTDRTSADTAGYTEADYSDFAAEDIDSEHLIYVREPEGASVYIDGSFMCIAPGSFKKITGTHVITFIKDGYKTMSYTIEVSDDGLDSYFTFPILEAESE